MKAGEYRPLHISSILYFPFSNLCSSLSPFSLSFPTQLRMASPVFTVKKTEPLFPRLEPTEEEKAAEEATRQRQATGRGKTAQGDKAAQQQGRS
jgi:hypothetical protein